MRLSRGSVLESRSWVVVVSDVVGWFLENKDLVHAKKPRLGDRFLDVVLSGPSSVVSGRTGVLGSNGTGVMVVTPLVVLVCEDPRVGID